MCGYKDNTFNAPKDTMAHCCGIHDENRGTHIHPQYAKSSRTMKHKLDLTLLKIVINVGKYFRHC